MEGFLNYSFHFHDADVCLRPGYVSDVAWARQRGNRSFELSSQNGVLTVNLTMRTLVDSGGVTHYCYWYDDTTEAPTLRVNPGDTLIFNLTNDLPPSPAGMQRGSADTTSGDPCAGGPMTISSTNVHYHGLNIPPTCHQDEVIKTTIQPG